MDASANTDPCYAVKARRTTERDALGRATSVKPAPQVHRQRPLKQPRRAGRPDRLVDWVSLNGSRAMPAGEVNSSTEQPRSHPLTPISDAHHETGDRPEALLVLRSLRGLHAIQPRIVAARSDSAPPDRSSTVVREDTMRHPGRRHLTAHRGPIAVSALVLVRSLTPVVLAPAAGWIAPLAHEISQVVPSLGVRVHDRDHGSMFHTAPAREQGETAGRRRDDVIVAGRTLPHRSDAAPSTPGHRATA
jgi:hypothetical protein